MCWVSSQAVKQIAEEDIKVFKIGIKGGSNKFMSYYFSHLYILSQKYETEIYVICRNGETIINTGFHSYNPKCCRVLPCKTSTSTHYKIFNEDRRVCLDFYFGFGDKLLIAECTIPKGAEYFENKSGEIVSNQIIIENIKSIE